MRLHVIAFAAALTAAALLVASDNPFVGRWKLNPAKSHFTGDSVTFEKADNGMKLSSAGWSYVFETDGKDAPAVFGWTAAWKQVNDHGWEAANKRDGRLMNTDRWTLSGDDKTLTVITNGTKADGTPFEDLTVYIRESGTQGLVGKWRNKEVKIGSPGGVEFTAFEAEGLTCRGIGDRSEWSSRLDGEDVPMTGPRTSKGLTVSPKRTGPRVIEYTVKLNGKPTFRGTATVSEDGKTLTWTGTPVSVQEPITAVYDRE